MTHTSELINKLRQQYTLNNDGGGLDGKCRVSNKDLLALLLIAESLEQQNAALSEQVAGLVADLKKYGVHELDCNAYREIDKDCPDELSRECNCGFDAAIAKAGSHE